MGRHIQPVDDTPQTIFLLKKSLTFDTLSAINDSKLLSVKIKHRNGV